MKLFSIASITVCYGIITDSCMHRLWESSRNMSTQLLVFHRSLRQRKEEQTWNMRLFQSRLLRYLSRMDDRYVQLFILFIFNASRDTRIRRPKGRTDERKQSSRKPSSSSPSSFYFAFFFGLATRRGLFGTWPMCLGSCHLWLPYPEASVCRWTLLARWLRAFRAKEASHKLEHT